MDQQSGRAQGVGRAAGGLLLALAASVSGCADPDRAAAATVPEEPGVGAPPVAGLASGEPELAAYLQERIDAVRAAPSSGSMRGRLALAYHANGFDEALIAYGQAERLDPREFRWPYLAALLLGDRGDHEAALARIERALAIDPRYAPAWLWRGAWLLDSARPQEAEAAFEQARQLAEEAATLVSAILGLARSQLRRGDDQAALARLEAVEQLAPGHWHHPRLQGALARVYRRLGRAEAAAAAERFGENAVPLTWPDGHRQALGAHVRGFSGRLAQAEALLQEADPMAAVERLEALRDARPEDRELLNNLAVAYRLVGREAEAVEVLELGIELHPEHASFHFNLAAVHHRRGEMEAALRSIDRTLGLRPDLADANEAKVDMLVGERRFEEALAALQAAERHSAVGPQMHFQAGTLAGYLGRWTEAVRHLERAAWLDPGHARAQLLLGHSLIELDRVDEARAAFVRAAELGAGEEARQALDRLSDESDS